MLDERVFGEAPRGKLDFKKIAARILVWIRCRLLSKIVYKSYVQRRVWTSSKLATK